jgi:hypothetical protein
MRFLGYRMRMLNVIKIAIRREMGITDISAIKKAGTLVHNASKPAESYRDVWNKQA